MANIPKTMKAWVATRAGVYKDVLELKANWPTPPLPKAGEIMIRVSYVALNPGDIKLMALRIPCKQDTIPGMDFVGEVVQVGPSASKSNLDMDIGMVVAGTVPVANILCGTGVLAEYAVFPAHMAVMKPVTLDESVAPGILGVAGQTTAVLLRAADLKKGERVLVNGASGGVGSILLQALRGMSVHVTGVCSAKNEAFVRRLGAEEVVDYTARESLYDHLTSLYAVSSKGPFDVVVDCVGDETLYHRSHGYLKPDGKFLSIEAGPFGFLQQFKNNYWPVILGGTPATFINILSKPSGYSAKEVVNLFEKGWIREVPVDSTFEMNNVIQVNYYNAKADL
ncbi:zinc alcohol dehydrogenase [Hypoxylon trugodes]|uniref:zinc alcohol dehydrogenase n=1 Tax=Hypoxylon trugodes TaxID=326681 RepID=UPI00218F542F|nr:zinc alcohol dehydrogenase [Hypoxylon trugodes]KAI1384352.1 zinc alcohol dehydrogenase [Hypoxylon trugodes]